MNSLRYFLFFSLNLLAFISNAQDFKVIEETKDYILKECDSVYYYTHGLPPKDDFVIDTTKINKINGVLKLPLDNGKEVVFKNRITERWDSGKYKGLGDLLEEYYSKNLNMYAIFQYESCLPIYLINKQNGDIDTVSCKIPIFSPTNLYYFYCACCCKASSNQKNIFFKKVISRKKIGLDFYGSYPDYFNWVDDFELPH